MSCDEISHCYEIATNFGYNKECFVVVKLSVIRLITAGNDRLNSSPKGCFQFIILPKWFWCFVLSGVDTRQELIKKQGNKPERNYIELAPGTPVWVQHRQNATWEPATVVNQRAPNSYWIMQKNSAEQPRVYRCTRTMLKIRSTLTEGEQTAQMKEWTTESRSIESYFVVF